MALYEVKYTEGKATYTFVPIGGESVPTARAATTTRRSTTDSSQCVSTHEPLKKSSKSSRWKRSTGCKTSKKQSTHKEKTTSVAREAASNTAPNSTKFICPSCEFGTNKRQLMIEHLTVQHLKNSNDVEQQKQLAGKLSCDQCGFSSYDQDDLDFHSCNKVQQLGSGSADLPWNSGNSSASLSCHLCTFECLTRTGLQLHITRKHKIKSGESAAGALLTCNECDYKCANKSTLYSHRRKHQSSRVPNKQQTPKLCGQAAAFFCNECDYSSTKKSALFEHIKKAAAAGGHVAATAAALKQQQQTGCRKDQLLFNCEQCPYTNKNRYEMKVHVIRKHSNEYNYECEQCGKKYKIKGDLTNHIRFQHREQPIICDVCGKTCGNSNSLYVHQKFAHYKAEFECPICKRRMVSQANLDEHVLKQHEQREDAICEECGKTFTRQSRLKIHMRIHLGIKPHVCKLCAKAFSRKTALRQHLLIHSGQRPYLCDICGKAFTQKPGLISHRKSHPGTHPPLPRVTIDHVLSDLLASNTAAQ